MRQTFLYAYTSTDYLRITPPPYLIGSGCFFGFFHAIHIIGGRGHDLLKGEGGKNFFQLKLNFYVWRGKFQVARGHTNKQR